MNGTVTGLKGPVTARQHAVTFAYDERDYLLVSFILSDFILMWSCTLSNHFRIKCSAEGEYLSKIFGDLSL